jgi:hypothetical protein
MVSVQDDDVILVDNIRRGIDADISLNTLATRYYPMFEKIVYHFSNIYNCRNIDPSDYLVSYTMILSTSINKYNPLIGSYKTYLNQLLANGISKEMLRKINSNDITNTFISLDSQSGEDMTYHEIIADEDDLSPVEYTNINEVKLILRGQTKKKLEPNEELQLRAINMRVFGFTIHEIADKLGVSFTTVRRLLEASPTDRNIRRIKIRLK